MQSGGKMIFLFFFPLQ